VAFHRQVEVASRSGCPGQMKLRAPALRCEVRLVEGDALIARQDGLADADQPVRFRTGAGRV